MSQRSAVSEIITSKNLCMSLKFMNSLQRPGSLFLARDSIYAIARYMLSPVRLSVRPSLTRVDQSKTVEVRITQPFTTE